VHHADRAGRIREKADVVHAGIFEMLPNILRECNKVAVVLGSYSGPDSCRLTGDQPKFDWFGLEDDPQSYPTSTTCILYLETRELAQAIHGKLGMFTSGDVAVATGVAGALSRHESNTFQAVQYVA
jgi:hypothetical protein